MGPFEANQGANADSAEIATRMISPIPPKRVRNRRRSRSNVEQIDHDIHDDHRAGDQDDHAHDHLGVAGANRLDHQGSHTRVGEDRFEQDRAAHGGAERVPHHRDDRQDGIANHVSHDDLAPRQAFLARRDDVPLLQRLPHAGTHETCHAGGFQDGVGGDRQHQIGCPLEQPVDARGARDHRAHALRRQPPEMDREPHDEQLANPEGRHRVADQHEARPCLIDAPMRRNGRLNADRDADQQAKRIADTGEQQRAGKPFRQDVEDRPAVIHGVAKIAVQHVHQIAVQALKEWLIELEALLQRGA